MTFRNTKESTGIIGDAMFGTRMLARNWRGEEQKVEGSTKSDEGKARSFVTLILLLLTEVPCELPFP